MKRRKRKKHLRIRIPAAEMVAFIGTAGIRVDKGSCNLRYIMAVDPSDPNVKLYKLVGCDLVDPFDDCWRLGYLKGVEKRIITVAYPAIYRRPQLFHRTKKIFLIDKHTHYSSVKQLVRIARKNSDL